MDIKYLQKTIGHQKDKPYLNLGDEWCEVKCGYLNNKELINFLEIGKEKTK
jgi:hypothetical protein